MQSFKLALFFAIVFLCITVNAQDENGSLQFIGHNFYDTKELLYTQIKVRSSNNTTTEIETEKSNSFKTKLAYGFVYDIYFTNAKAQTMFVRVFANIPPNKQTIKCTYELDIPFFPRDPQTFDTSQFRNPFHQIIFDGKSKFVDDTVYMNAFLRKVLKLQELDTANYYKAKPVKQYVQLTGKLSLENDKQSPLKNKTVLLINKNGEKISSSQTSNHGIFVFQGIDITTVDAVKVLLGTTDNPNKEKVKIETNAHELIDYTVADTKQEYVFNANETNTLIKKLIDKDFKYNIGGKLILNDGSIKKIASDKEIFLLNNKNNQLQKVKTDLFGNFIFTKIIPGQNYVIAFDTIGCGTRSKLELYTIKDKFVKKIDSISANKFNYKLLAVSGNEFNDLILDDSELKMNVKARLFGDTKNNPLKEFKVLLLNDKFTVIDSAVTNKEGDFIFNNMPYNRQIMISSNNDKSTLEAINNILVFDNSENLIKIVSTFKGTKFEYRPLPIEQSRITEIYVDEPWLKVVNYKKGANTVIIENILFEFNKVDLLPQSKQTLDKVILAMQLNKTFNIELGAHTDSKGSDAYNLTLSEQRATAAKNYLVNNGVPANRIVAVGYGETKLINNCNNTVLCSDDEHAVNRRLEFKLIYN